MKKFKKAAKNKKIERDDVSHLKQQKANDNHVKIVVSMAEMRRFLKGGAFLAALVLLPTAIYKLVQSEAIPRYFTENKLGSAITPIPTALTTVLDTATVTAPSIITIDSVILEESQLEFKEHSLYADEKPAPQKARTDYYPSETQIGLRHIEGKGLGYSQGYTSLTLFSVIDTQSKKSRTMNPYQKQSRVLPLADVRGHCFDDRKFAANAGTGFRMFSEKGYFILGLFGYYDYRQFHHHYNQASGGLELFSSKVDFRLNGYFPFGGQTRSYDRDEFDYEGGYEAIVRKKVPALTGGDASLSTSLRRWLPCNNWDIYAQAGPYFYAQKACQGDFWGGFGNVGIQFLNYFTLQGSVSYDPVFKRIFQGLFGITIAIGKVKQTTNCNKMDMNEIARQPVRRNEIIVLGKKQYIWQSNFN